MEGGREKSNGSKDAHNLISFLQRPGSLVPRNTVARGRLVARAVALIFVFHSRNRDHMGCNLLQLARPAVVPLFPRDQVRTTSGDHSD